MTEHTELSVNDERPQRLEITTPDDWHVHLRDGAALQHTVAATAASFGRAIVMPNLVPPVTTAEAAVAYRDRILRHVPEGVDFEPLMTLYLTDNTTPAQIEAARASGVIACKLYPAGATTNSSSGVTDIRAMDDALAAMAEVQMPLLVHGEVTDPRVDVFDREAVFLERVLGGLLQRHRRLKIVLEHITTGRAARFVASGPPTLAATITAHHLLVSRNDMLAGGIRPHLYCLPILKREEDRKALLVAATSSSPKFFLGTDSAPHASHRKESACGCAGCYTAPIAMALYAEAFEQVDALDQLEDFASARGAAFYGLSPGVGRLVLQRRSQHVPVGEPLGAETVTPFRAGGEVGWVAARRP